MAELHSSFISKSFLRSHWDIEFKAWIAGGNDAPVKAALERWAARRDLKETSAEGAFVEVFFRDLWGYLQAGQAGAEAGFTLYPKYPVAGAGAKGGVGEADLAVGYFTHDKKPETPQVLCEFKDVRSALDVEQKRKGNNRSPVRQGLDYLSFARRGLIGSEPILPTWCIVSDMNEFRLYWYERGHHQFLRFVIAPRNLFEGVGLLAQSSESQFERFLFARVFHRETLLTRGGKSTLLGLVQQQRFKDRDLEKQFYDDYKRVRDRLYTQLLEHNAEGTDRFPGTRGRIVRLAQKLLDRMIFVFYCEDMGRALAFPPQLLRNFLISRSNDPYYNEDAFTTWDELKGLFSAMNDGTTFGSEKINKFNGGLFAPDPDLEKLRIPNSVFCRKGQGQNEASLYLYKDTLLYICASYNYASTWAQGLDNSLPLVEAAGQNRQTVRSLGLYTLGRIFEQSITELEILEAEADGRLSLNEISKRKRDGVYYTPEWVVERIVDETITPRFEELKRECGWPKQGAPKLAALDAFMERLRSFTVLDPACGSGAFLITVLRVLVDEWRKLREMRKLISGEIMAEDDAALIRDVLRSNIYGVDINAASVEIARLALWLHTARGDKPLSSLDGTIREGNSLINEDFYKGQVDLNFYDADEKERVNAFDWEENFPEVFKRGGFDAVVGNPPYVKLQNFRRVHPDVANFIKDGRAGTESRGYKSAKTGNFDLYLPFIEKGIDLLNPDGRLGYIAPSLWPVNEYGEGLRKEIERTRQLERWVDFKAHQIFEEATVYTALMFFTRRSNDSVRIVQAPNGFIPENAFANDDCALPYKRLGFGDRWLLVTGPERELIDRLAKTCTRLDDAANTKNIYQGLITSADAVYHLERIAPGRYLSIANGKDNPHEVELEDALMKPLVSGAEAKRYQTPVTMTCLLFPYAIGNRVDLIPAGRMAKEFPLAWRYLRQWEDRLRKREASLNEKTGDFSREQNGEPVRAPFNDEAWYRFGRNQNLDKQETPKLVVPRLVANLTCSIDDAGAMFLDNVDVGGIQAADGVNLFWLGGLINSPVLRFVFKRLSKPFRGEFLSANKQFIAPLPIPKASSKQRDGIAERAAALQKAHSRRRDLLALIAKRMVTLRKRTKPAEWLFRTMTPKRDLEDAAPANLDLAARRAWATTRYNDDLAANEEAVGEQIAPGVTLDAQFNEGELSFLVNGAPVVSSIFEDKESGAFILAQWKVLASSLSISDSMTGKNLCGKLRKLAPSDGSPAVNQILAYQAELAALDASILQQEAAMNAAVYALYKLTPEEITLVERG